MAKKKKQPIPVHSGLRVEGAFVAILRHHLSGACASFR